LRIDTSRYPNYQISNPVVKLCCDGSAATAVNALLALSPGGSAALKELTVGLERIISPMAGYSGSSPRKPAQVLADIKRGKLAPVYILFGADTAAADELLRALRKALVQPGMEAFDSETVDAVDRPTAAGGIEAAAGGGARD
jgi:hypothetical protein